MRLLVFPVQFRIFLALHKQGQFIFIDPLLLIIIIIPDKTTFLPLFRERSISQYFPVFIFCIKVKDKYTLGIQIIIHQTEYFLQFFFIRHIIHGIADA